MNKKMKKNIFFATSLLLMMQILTSCDPITEDGASPKVIDESEFVGSVTPVKATDGKNSNRVICEMTSPGSAQWTDGVLTKSSNSAIMDLFITGKQTITCTVQNQDGSTFTKTYPVTVDEMTYAVDPTYGLLCGSGSKVWTWDTSLTNVWGNGGYLENTAPGWYCVPISDLDAQCKTYGCIGDGDGGQMTFTLNGLKFSKTSGQSGTFSFDMTAIVKSGWSVGKLYTKNTGVLLGIQTNNGGAIFTEYNILLLDEHKLVLCAPEPGAGDWGTGWFWMFQAVK